MFGLKLLNCIVDRNPGHIAKLKQICAESGDPNPILVTIASFYQVNHPRLNKYTLSLMKILVGSKEFGI
jgi:predicted membrane-bound dolichyl-phosphate-mannose-protein mannosyltransferase